MAKTGPSANRSYKLRLGKILEATVSGLELSYSVGVSFAFSRAQLLTQEAGFGL